MTKVKVFKLFRSQNKTNTALFHSTFKRIKLTKQTEKKIQNKPSEQLTPENPGRHDEDTNKVEKEGTNEKVVKFSPTDTPGTLAEKVKNNDPDTSEKSGLVARLLADRLAEVEADRLGDRLGDCEAEPLVDRLAPDLAALFCLFWQRIFA